MQINDDKTVEFEVDDFVCEITTGSERCGTVEEHNGVEVRLSSNDAGVEDWWVVESACYPG